LDRGPSPSLIGTQRNSRNVSPLSDISDRLEVNCSTSTRVLSPSHLSPTYSPVGSTISAVSSNFSSFRVLQTHNPVGENRVRLQTTKMMYTYKKISELMEPEQKVNMYGVISTITKVKLILNLADI
jgi:hypothetical protein